MPFQVRLNATPPLVEAVFAGKLTPPELTAAAEGMLDLARKNAVYRVLADCTALEGGHSLFDLYALADFIFASGLSNKIKEAVVLPLAAEAVEAVRFWEITCKNRGILVKVCEDRQSAIDWLKE